MYTLKLLIVVAALACSGALQYPDLDENGNPIDHPEERGTFRVQNIERNIRIPKYDKTIPRYVKGFRIMRNEKKSGDTTIKPSTTTLATRIPPLLRKMLKEGSLLPRYLAEDNYVRAVKSSTTPDTYLDTEEQADKPVLRRMNGKTSEDSNEVMENIDIIPPWIFSHQYMDDDVNEVVLQSFLEAAAEADNQPKVLVNSVWERPEENAAEEPTNAGLTGTDDDTKKFAAKPDQYGFYDFDSDDMENVTELWIMEETTIENLDLDRVIRQGSQDPKSKGLVSDEIGPLRAAFSTEKMQETVRTKYHHYGNKNNYDSLYGLPLLIAVCVALTVAIVGFVFGWSALSRKAKAAAEVDYPTYGVTGPSVVTTGDRRLAHSAHIYHYQHQKQQIIAMENNGMETRPGSISDPESEDNGDDGDYTVYECPGLATTGDMEVKNPMFNDEPTPGKSSLEQPKSEE